MPEMLGSIGSFFGGSSGKGLLDVLGLGSAGMGLFGNIETERARSQQLDMIKNAERTLVNPQALAPFEQQNQNTALQLVMERLGLPIQYANAYLQGLPKSSNMSPLLALL